MSYENPFYQIHSMKCPEMNANIILPTIIQLIQQLLNYDLEDMKLLKLLDMCCTLHILTTNVFTSVYKAKDSFLFNSLITFRSLNRLLKIVLIVENWSSLQLNPCILYFMIFYISNNIPSNLASQKDESKYFYKEQY